MSTQSLDPKDCKRVVDKGLSEAKKLGVSHAEIRIEHLRSQYVGLRDGQLETTMDDREVGVGVRIHKGGHFGFAASVAKDTEAVRALVATAVETARIAAQAGGRAIELATEPVHQNVRWTAPFKSDPTLVPLDAKVEKLASWSDALLEAKGVDHVDAHVLCVSEDKYYGDLAGSTAIQRRVRVHPQVSAITVAADGDFEELRTCAPPVGRGWEYLEGDGWDFEAEIASMPEELMAKFNAPSVKPGTYDLVIDPTNLWLTIHESIGHATELDRALGYEAAYAGTSFATFENLGSLRYGSPLMVITGDRTAEYGLATVAIDDEGVEGQSFDIVRNGILVGYQLDRAIAAEVGIERSNGCAFADSPLHVPIQRMANVSLVPGPEFGPTTKELIAQVQDGIYVVGDRSWSIDMQRYNFQFTGQRFYRIEGGEITGHLKDVAYQATTTEFWGSLSALGGQSTYLLAGAFNCGKGQPGQVAPVSHGCPSAVFKGVRVLNTKEESGR